MKTYKDYITESLITEALKGNDKIYSLLKVRMPNSDLSKVDKNITLEGMFGTLFMGYKGVFFERCGKNDDIVNTVLAMIGEMFGEDFYFMKDVYNGNIPTSKHIKLKSRVKEMMQKYFSWDKGVKDLHTDKNLTVKEFLDRKMKDGEDVGDIIGIFDTEFENYACWIASVAIGKEVTRRPGLL